MSYKDKKFVRTPYEKHFTRGQWKLYHIDMQEKLCQKYHIILVTKYVMEYHRVTGKWLIPKVKAIPRAKRVKVRDFIKKIIK